MPGKFEAAANSRVALQSVRAKLRVIMAMTVRGCVVTCVRGVVRMLLVVHGSFLVMAESRAARVAGLHCQAPRLETAPVSRARLKADGADRRFSHRG